MFFDNRKNRQFDFSNIDVEILTSKNNIQEYIEYLNNEGWVYIPFTESKRHSCTYDEYTNLNETLNSHKVIGQEFDKVIVILDNGFEFKNNREIYLKRSILVFFVFLGKHKHRNTKTKWRY